MTDREDREPVPLGNIRRPRAPVPDPERAARQDRSTRDAIFLAAGGRGAHREGAFPIALDRPHDGARLEPWDPAGYTLSMIRHAWPLSSERLLTEADWKSLRGILEQRVQEIRDERAKKKSPARRALALPARKSLPATTDHG